MADYVLGVIFGILAGLSNFSGQVLTKKAINDTPKEIRDAGLIKALVKNKLWLVGIILGIVSGLFIVLAQQSIGGALTPGLMASGFIVLAIGSVYLLNEKLQAAEIVAIILLVLAITLIGLSELSIEGNIEYFNDINFNIRIIVYSIIFTGLWLGLYFTGRKINSKYNTILLAVGTGLPFAVGNIWVQPLLVSIMPILGGTANSLIWIIFIISALFVIFTNIFGLAHYQYALNSGNASLVVPVQQMPQQIVPILIFYIIYQLASPRLYSLPFVITGVCLITIASLLLGKRQAQFEKFEAEKEKDIMAIENKKEAE